MSKKSKKYVKGAVSIYVVIFTALIISIITVSFIRIMVSNERQSSNSDLSQSARDSALAGVEDAKIALLKYTKQCPNGKITSADCQAIYDKITGDCNEFHSYMDGSVGDSKNTEVIVQRNDNDGNKQDDESLQQAYTCAKIQVETDDVLGVMQAGKSELIPLIPEAGKTIDSVELSWYTIGDNSGKTGVNNPGHPGNLSQTNADWGVQAPSLIRLQLIQSDATFTLDQLDAQGTSKNTSDRGMLFLYPRTNIAQTEADLSNAVVPLLGASAQYNNVQAPVNVKCVADFKDANGYACTASIKLPNTISDSPARANAFIRLTGFYHDQTNYKLVMKSGGDVVRFDGVQPAVDVTGRASNLYRRIESRVQLYGDGIFPEFAVDMDKDGDGTGQFCKVLTITDKSNDQQPGNTIYDCPKD